MLPRTKPHVRLKPGATAHHAAGWNRNETKTWVAPQLSADAALLPELHMLQRRTEDMGRNSGVSVGVMRTLEENILGTGLRLSLRPDYRAMKRSKEWADAFARAVESQWQGYYWSTAADAADIMTGDGVTGLAFRSYVMAGETTAVPHWIDRADGFYTKQQVIDPDRLSQPEGRPPTLRFRAGVEYDQYGAPLAYHVRKTHPGDMAIEWSAGIAEWERIQRRTAFGRLRFIHAFEPERPGQTRGKPLLTPVLSNFKTADRYVGAELQAALVNALVAMTIETPMSEDGVLELFNNDHEKYMKARAEHAVRLQGGVMLPLFPGDKAQGFLPTRPAAQFGAFLENCYRLIGLPVGLPLELLLKDFSKTNYSSARASLLEAWRSFLRRRDAFGTAWMDPWLGLWAEEMVHAGTLGDGSISPEEFYEHRRFLLRTRWVGGGRGWVDPLKEAQAARERMEAGISTLEDECAEQGRDWRETLEQQAIEQAERARLGLPAPAALTQRGDPNAPGPDDEDEAPADDRRGIRPPNGNSGAHAPM